MIEEIINRNRNINRGFRKLEVWQEAVELFVFVKKETNELAVMIDPFNPVKITQDAINLEIGDYYHSWMHKNGVAV